MTRCLKFTKDLISVVVFLSFLTVIITTLNLFIYTIFSIKNTVNAQETFRIVTWKERRPIVTYIIGNVTLKDNSISLVMTMNSLSGMSMVNLFKNKFGGIKGCERIDIKFPLNIAMFNKGDTLTIERVYDVSLGLNHVIVIYNGAFDQITSDEGSDTEFECLKTFFNSM